MKAEFTLHCMGLHVMCNLLLQTCCICMPSLVNSMTKPQPQHPGALVFQTTTRECGSSRVEEVTPPTHVQCQSRTTILCHSYTPPAPAPAPQSHRMVFDWHQDVYLCSNQPGILSSAGDG